MPNRSKLIKKAAYCFVIIILSMICFSAIDISIPVGNGENICAALRLVAKAIVLGADLICTCIIIVH